MTDEFESRELRRVFASLDDDDATPPHYSDRLWVELETTLNREPLAPTQDDTVVIELDSAPSRRRRVAGAWLGVRIAAGGAAAALAVFTLIDRDSTVVDTVNGSPTIASTSTLPVLIDPLAACARYFDNEWSIDRLVEGDLSVADFDAALDAIDQLRLDLEASGEFTTAELSELTIARGSILQSKLELAEGLLVRAEASLGGVADRLALYDDQGDDPRCVPADE